MSGTLPQDTRCLPPRAELWFAGDGAALTYGRAETGFLVPTFVAWGDPGARQ